MIVRKYIVAAMVATTVLSVFTFPVMAKPADHVGCEKIEKLAVGKMGLVDEAALQKHIAQMEKTLGKVKRKAARRAEHRKLLKAHLADMQQAMKEVHNLKLKSGCLEAAHGASLDTRVMLIEKRLDLMQATMGQMVGHQQEIERE